jgi:hypothetical protein
MWSWSKSEKVLYENVEECINRFQAWKPISVSISYTESVKWKVNK